LEGEGNKTGPALSRWVREKTVGSKKSFDIIKERGGRGKTKPRPKEQWLEAAMEALESWS